MIASFYCLKSPMKDQFGRIMRHVGCGVLAAVCLASTAVHANDQISVGTVNGKDIWLDDVLRAAERLPEEFQQTPLENYFSQLVADLIDSQLAATAARNDAYNKKPEIATAMQMAANRVLAESWLAEKVRAEITEKAIQSAYDKFVADSASREQVTASHILVETEAEAEGDARETDRADKGDGDGGEGAQLGRHEPKRHQVIRHECTELDQHHRAELLWCP